MIHGKRSTDIRKIKEIRPFSRWAHIASPCIWLRCLLELFTCVSAGYSANFSKLFLSPERLRGGSGSANFHCSHTQPYTNTRQRDACAGKAQRRGGQPLLRQQSQAHSAGMQPGCGEHKTK